MALTGVSRLGPVPLRLAVGAACAWHGYQTLFEGPSFDSFIQRVQALAVPRPEITAHVVAWGALAGGIMLILGFGTRLAALLNAVTLGGILWYVKLGPDPQQVVDRLRTGFDAPDGYLTPLVLLLACLSLVLTGAGSLSLDAFLAYRRQRD